MKKNLKIFTHIILLIVLITGGIAVHKQVRAQSTPAANVSGWAWSSNVGWISFNCTDISNLCSDVPYGVNVDPTSGKMTGFAWSSNVGWLSFNEGDTIDCPGGIDCAAKIDLQNGKITGFARFCAGTENGDCSGGGREDSWDGWVKLSDASLPDFISPEVDGSKGATLDLNTNYIVGYAWGSNVVGLIKFKDASFGVHVDVGNSSPQCDISGIKYNVGTTISKNKGPVTDQADCEVYNTTCQQVSPTVAQWSQNLDPLINNEYPYDGAICGIKNPVCTPEQNNVCDIRAFTPGTSLDGVVISIGCGDSMKFYKNKIIPNNASGTRSCDNTIGNMMIRTCENGVLSGSSTYDKLICRVNIYQKEK